MKANLKIVVILGGLALLTVPLLGKGKPGGGGGGQSGEVVFRDEPLDVMTTDGGGASGEYNDLDEDVSCLMYSQVIKLNLLEPGGPSGVRSIWGNVFGDGMFHDCWEFRTTGGPDGEGVVEIAAMLPGDFIQASGALKCELEDGDFELFWPCISIWRMPTGEWLVWSDPDMLDPTTWAQPLEGGNKPRRNRDLVAEPFPAPFEFTFTLLP